MAVYCFTYDCQANLNEYEWVLKSSWSDPHDQRIFFQGQTDNFSTSSHNNCRKALALQ